MLVTRRDNWMTTRQFSFLQISLTFILSVGMVNHVLLIPQLMEVSGRDSWITVLLACVVFLPVFIIIGYIVKRHGTPGCMTGCLSITGNGLPFRSRS